AEYRLRSSENREEAARQFGGTDDSERAVRASLTWLESVQHRDGYWDAGAYGAGRAPEATSASDRPNVGGDSDSGVTALAILAFLGAGHTPDRGTHSETVERALRWMVSRQRDDGYLGGEASSTAAMYCHGIATFALAESYGLRSDPLSSRWLRRPVEKAIAYIAEQQLEDGGWRYEKGQPDGDMSMFGWQLMALKSAEIAGVPLPTGVKDRMIRFLQERSLGDRNGLASYRLGREFPVTPAMTAEALFCKQILGISRDNPASSEGVAYLVRHLPRRSQTNYYYWYYGTLSMFHYGGEEWAQWNNALRDLLVSTQVSNGRFAGSWEPRGPWGPYGGRVYSTAIATLCLEVYYRYLPLYQASDGYGRN
ncbi:MAG: prenyltransferase/squalene oxidase repeat-containing protein, partial [Maioricimonas sp. JB049]